jgi:hypothetical protein
MKNFRNIFIVLADGEDSGQKNFEETIQRKRNLDEISEFLPQSEIDNLKNIYHGSPFIVWGSVPGPGNQRNWERMKVGDIVLVINQKNVKFYGEIGAKVAGKEVSHYLWDKDKEGKMWELMYLLVNEESLNIPFDKVKVYFGYKENYNPRGLNIVSAESKEFFESHYGTDVLGVLKNLQLGKEVVEIPSTLIDKKESILVEKEEKEPTEHDEMQWLLIQLGKKSGFEVWIPKNDRHKKYKGNSFADFTLEEFSPIMDVPLSIKNIDVVWKLGPYSIKAAFEIEHSTSVYSGLLRLSDLKVSNPNSSYPLFIVASDERRTRVFEQLRRPTFFDTEIKLHEVLKLLTYEKIKKNYIKYKDYSSFEPQILFDAGENLGDI